MKKKNNNEEMLRLAIKRYDDECEIYNDEYKEMEYDLHFATNHNGAQWDEGIRSERENSAAPRPCLVINKIKEKVDVIQGEFREIEPSVKISAIDSQADIVVADIYNGLIKHIEYASSARQAYNNAFNSTLYTGMGCWRIDIKEDPDDPFVKELRINPISDVFSVRFDPFSRRYDKKDARYVFVVNDIPIDDFKQRWPDVDTEGWNDKDQNSGWLSEKSVRVAEYWFKQSHPTTYHKVSRDGVLIVIKDGEELLPTDQIVETKTVNKDKIYYGKLIHDQWIEGPFDDWPIDKFPIVFNGGKYNYIDGLVRYHGMTRYARDPQQMFNYWSSTITETVALQPKSPYMVTAETLSNPEYKMVWDEADKRNFFYLPINVDPSGYTPQRQAPPQVSSALANELDRTSKDIMSTMGIYSASLGDTGPEQSGMAISARQKQGSLGSYLYMDNFSLSLAHSTKIIIDLIPFVYDTTRQIRILGPDSQEKVVFINSTPQYIHQTGAEVDPSIHSKSEGGMINDLSVGKYDVAVTMGPGQSTQRQENTELMINLLQTVPHMADIIAPILIKNIDNPATQEITQLLQERSEQPPPQDPLVGLAEKDLALKGKQLELKAFKEAKDLELKAQKNELDELKAIVEVLKNKLNVTDVNAAEQGLNLDN